MGNILIQYYEYLQKNGKISQISRFALKTAVSIPSAETLPDSPENISKFRDALQEILETQEIPVFN